MVYNEHERLVTYSRARPGLADLPEEAAIRGRTKRCGVLG